MTGTRRWRRCPSCHEVFAAGNLITTYRQVDSPWSNGAMQRRCPNCNHRGVTRDFEVVSQTWVGRASA